MNYLLCTKSFQKKSEKASHTSGEICWGKVQSEIRNYTGHFNGENVMGELIQSSLGCSRIEKSRAWLASNPRSWEGNREELAVIRVEKAGGGGAWESGGSDWPVSGVSVSGWGSAVSGLRGHLPGSTPPISLVQECPKKASNQNPYCRCGKDHP